MDQCQIIIETNELHWKEGYFHCFLLINIIIRLYIEIPKKCLCGVYDTAFGNMKSKKEEPSPIFG